MERIIFEREPGSDTYELRIGALPAAAGVLSTPSAREIARAVSAMGGDWFMRFVAHLAKESPNRAFEVAAVANRADLDQDALEFGINPSDSASLLELRNAIDDSLGWFDDEDKESGDYAWRVRQVGQMVRDLKSVLR